MAPARLRRRFQELREPLLPNAAEFAARKMGPVLMAQARSLQDQPHDLSMCEDSLTGLMLLLSDPPSDDRMRKLGDEFFQVIRSLATMMAQTAEARTADGVDPFTRLTQDRESQMAGIREKYFDRVAALNEEGKRYIFKMTDLFARSVFFMHRCAKSWQVRTSD